MAHAYAARTASRIIAVTSSSAAEKAAEALLGGHVIAVPTDTVYGLAALVQNKRAVQRLYEIKGRDLDKPIAICVAEIEDVGKWGHVTVPDHVLRQLLPGPVTLVFQRKEDLNPDLNPGENLVGVRIPDYPFIREVCRHVGAPVALTSANISSTKSTLDVSEFTDLFPKLHSVFDGGRLSATDEARLGSTVVDLSAAVEGSFRIIRDGSALHRTQAILQKNKISSLGSA